jgi:hypothetical protein
MCSTLGLRKMILAAGWRLELITTVKSPLLVCNPSPQKDYLWEQKFFVLSSDFFSQLSDTGKLKILERKALNVSHK